jgi:hypothetical protein
MTRSDAVLTATSEFDFPLSKEKSQVRQIYNKQSIIVVRTTD